MRKPWLSKLILALVIVCCIVFAIQSCKKNNGAPYTYPYTITISGCLHVGDSIGFGFDNDNLPANSFLWKFGDGTTSTDAYSAHVYKQLGTYTVTLLINNDNSLLQTTTIQIIPVVAGSPYTALMGGVRSWTGSAYGYIQVWQTYANTQIVDTPWSVQIIDSGTVEFIDNTPLHIERVDTVGKALIFSDCNNRSLSYYYLSDSMAYVDDWHVDKESGSLNIHTLQ